MKILRRHRKQERNKMVEKLLKLRCGNTHSLFWNPWAKKCQMLDERRNSVAHWIMSTSHRIEGAMPQPPKTTLKHPTYRTKGDWHPEEEMAEGDLKQFIEECEDWAFIIRLFHGYLPDGDLRGRERHALHDIFQQPIPDPLPADSPLSRNWQAPETPPPPSRA